MSREDTQYRLLVGPAYSTVQRKFSPARWRFGRKIQSAPRLLSATCGCRRPALAERRAMAAGWPPRRIDRDGSGPVHEQAESPSNGGRRPRFPNRPPEPVCRCFGPIRAHFFMKSDFPEAADCQRTVAFAGAFGIALPLTASDRRHLGCGCSSVVEHDLAKVGVEGSNPFARSNFPLMANYRIDDRPPFGGLVVCGSVRTSRMSLRAIPYPTSLARNTNRPNACRCRVHVRKRPGQTPLTGLLRIETLAVSVAHKYSTARGSSCVPHVMTIEED